MGLDATRIELRGGGGEPVDFARTLLSHGVAELAPNVVAPDGAELDDGAARRPGRRGRSASSPTARTTAVVECPDAAPTRRSSPVIRHMLRLDEDLSAFYARAAEDPELAWAAKAPGGWLRSPTVFEDLVKTICTTNCTWSATLRMVNALVGELGVPAGDGRRDVPDARRDGRGADEAFYTGVGQDRLPRRLPAQHRRRRRGGPARPRSCSPTRRCPTTTSPSGCSRSRASGPYATPT